MAKNKIIFGGQTLLDLTGDTATPSDVASGKTFHDRSGTAQTGSYVAPTIEEITPLNTSPARLRSGNNYRIKINNDGYAIRNYSEYNKAYDPIVSVSKNSMYLFNSRGCIIDDYYVIFPEDAGTHIEYGDMFTLDETYEQSGAVVYPDYFLLNYNNVKAIVDRNRDSENFYDFITVSDRADIFDGGIYVDKGNHVVYLFAYYAALKTETPSSWNTLIKFGSKSYDFNLAPYSSNSVAQKIINLHETTATNSPTINLYPYNSADIRIGHTKKYTKDEEFKIWATWSVRTAA